MGGYILLGIGLAITGPSIFFGKDPSSVWSFYGLSLLGVGAAAIIIPQLPNIIEAVEEKYYG